MKRIHPLKRFYKTVDSPDIAYKLQNIPSFPYILEFEVTNNCNFHCLMCKTGMSTAKRERGYMSCDTYKKIIDEIKGKQIALKFVGQGEPLLHPNFPEFVKEAEENGIVCHLTTNASLLDEDMMDKLFSAGLESIKFSFQGVTREGYLEMRQKDNFEQLMNTISKLYNKRGNKERPYITIHTTV
ncbi:MAG: radical SAM protein, partial [Oscillospiraceae bacterium]